MSSKAKEAITGLFRKEEQLRLDSASEERPLHRIDIIAEAL